MILQTPLDYGIASFFISYLIFSLIAFKYISWKLKKLHIKLIEGKEA